MVKLGQDCSKAILHYIRRGAACYSQDTTIARLAWRGISLLHALCLPALTIRSYALLGLVKLFFDLCLLRAKPQDIPASRGLLGVTLAVYTTVSLILASVQLPAQRALLYALADVVILAVLTHLVLLVRRFPERFTQTLTALAGSGAVLGVITWPLAHIQQPSLLVLILVIWSISVTAHILRHALSLSLTLGIVISLGYLIVTLTIVGALFPPAP